MPRGLIVVAILLTYPVSGIMAADSFGFATWNIGHFARGLDKRSRIASAQVPEMSKRYRDLLTQAKVQVLGVCEHSQVFSSDGGTPADTSAFADFTQRDQGFSYGWQENAFYWKDCTRQDGGHCDFPLRRDKAHCCWLRLNVRGRVVCFVEAHCDWRTTLGRSRHDRQEQLEFLARTFEAEPLVVIAGDFNTAVPRENGGRDRDAPDEYEVFRKAGFKAAHWGELKTWPSKGPYLSIDNVFTKGLDMSEVAVLGDADLSDHALLRCTLSFR